MIYYVQQVAEWTNLKVPLQALPYINKLVQGIYKDFRETNTNWICQKP